MQNLKSDPDFSIGQTLSFPILIFYHQPTFIIYPADESTSLFFSQNNGDLPSDSQITPSVLFSIVGFLHSVVIIHKTVKKNGSQSIFYLLPGM